MRRRIRAAASCVYNAVARGVISERKKGTAMRSAMAAVMMILSAVAWGCAGAGGRSTGTTSTTGPATAPVSPSTTQPIRLLDGLGAVHHKVTTDSTEAQRYFDQGLAMVYGFNHDDAVRSFRQAQKLD